MLLAALLVLLGGTGPARADAPPDADTARAHDLARQGQCDQAVDLFRKALHADRWNADARLGLADCLTRLGRTDEALKEIEPGIQGNPKWQPRFLVARARARLARHELRDAGVDVTRAREMAPNDPAIRKAVGDFYRARGTWSLAIPEYQASLAIDSSDVEALAGLGEALYYDRKSDLALRTYRRAAALDTGYAPAQLGLGELLLRAGSAEPGGAADARTALEHYVRQSPSDPKGWVLLARADQRLGDRDAATAALDRAHALGDTTSLEALDRPATPAGGPAAGDAAARGAPTSPEATDAAYAALLARDSTSRQAAVAYGQRARLLYRGKDYRGALTLFDRALAIDPRDAETQFYRGISLKELGRDRDALASIQHATSLDARHGEWFFWLAAIEEKLGDRTHAIRDYERSIRLEPSGDLAATANRQAGFLRLLGRQWKAALPYLRRSVELNPRDVQAWLWLAQGQQNSGDRARASESYRRVLQLDPQNAEARRGLRTLGASSG